MVLVTLPFGLFSESGRRSTKRGRAKAGRRLFDRTSIINRVHLRKESEQIERPYIVITAPVPLECEVPGTTTISMRWRKIAVVETGASRAPRDGSVSDLARPRPFSR